MAKPRALPAAARHAAVADLDGVPFAAVVATREIAEQHDVPWAVAAAIGQVVAGIVRDAERARAASIAENQQSHQPPWMTAARIRGETV